MARLRDRASQLLDECRIPSAAIGVLRDGEISEFAVGIRDVTTGEPATTDTIYQLGSMSKTWTALAFMQLVDEGKVDLDEPVRTYLPEFRVADPTTSAGVTPRHLLNHTNGIEEAFGDPGEGDDVYARTVANIADAPQVFPLGTMHGYSAALGYAILARVMEVIDGRPWDAIMQARLFDRLALTGTSSRHEDTDGGRAATGHVIRSLAVGPIVTPVPYLPRVFGPGGNVASTVRDVLTMAALFLNSRSAPDGGRILSRASIHEMMESRVSVPDPFTFGPEWGLGLVVCNWGGETVYAHDGSTIGQNARLRIMPDRGVAIVVLTNGGSREGFFRRILNEILADLGGGAIPDLPQPDLTLRLDPVKYEGVYERPGARYEVQAVGNALNLSLVRDPWRASVSGQPERSTFELLPIDETHFLMPPRHGSEDVQTVAIYGFANGVARYLHTNCRVYPRVP